MSDSKPHESFVAELTGGGDGAEKERTAAAHSSHQAGSGHRPHERLRRAQPLRFGVITASDSRTLETDESGRLIAGMLEAAGHRVVWREVLPDDPERIRRTVTDRIGDLEGIIISGGTGIARRDTTFEAIRGLLEKELEGFGELFRMLSYKEIGPAAFLSRATAGVSSGKLVISLPGSPSACRLAMEKLLLPELDHIAGLLQL